MRCVECWGYRVWDARWSETKEKRRVVEKEQHIDVSVMALSVSSIRHLRDTADGTQWPEDRGHMHRTSCTLALAPLHSRIHTPLTMDKRQVVVDDRKEKRTEESGARGKGGLR